MNLFMKAAQRLAVFLRNEETRMGYVSDQVQILLNITRQHAPTAVAGRPSEDGGTGGKGISYIVPFHLSKSMLHLPSLDFTVAAFGVRGNRCTHELSLGESFARYFPRHQ